MTNATKRQLLLTILILGATLPTSDVSAEEPDKNEEHIEMIGTTIDGPGKSERGRKPFMQSCAPCHGANGDGTGDVSTPLTPPPRDLTAGIFKFKSTARAKPPTEGDLYRTIRDGLPGTSMPAWKGRLTEQQMWDIASFVRKELAEEKLPDEKDIIGVPKKRPPKNKETISEGKEAYKMYGCNSCHGKAGKGNGPSADGLKDYKNRSISPRNYHTDRFKGGNSAEEIFRTISAGIEGTPMTAFGPVIPPKKRWKIVYFVQSKQRDRSLWQYLFEDDVQREYITED